ncbi:ubiquinone biosynthesis O-methyltransferase, mitochondrial [Canna indica]|uniref:Ubiquinone biosynthesis O-methyltransferase, mitochondrial n=1 Tax=Canna indica TaxID=4628 RepID=A0AAQ3KVJ2_9LILI|nr:ubiquinone biosynthesis O-methyltransferase, mitochondrial [Canna indica]
MTWRVLRGPERAVLSFASMRLLNPASSFLRRPVASLLRLPVQKRSFADSAPLTPPVPETGAEAGSGDSSNSKQASFRSSLNEAELAKFSAIAETWWDSQGPFKPLHLMNPTRVSFIRSTLCRHFKKDPSSARPFEGLRIVDVGCGGGIVSEPLARLGATVTGIDAVEKNTNIARIHAASDPLTSSIEYRCTTAEELVKENTKFDAVISLEVIEHVADPLEFCKSLAALTVPNGATIVSTINRSMRSYATAIIAAEYLLNWLPKGTHEWSRFLTPEELVLILERTSVSVQEMAGFVYNPLTGDWTLSDDTSVNFIAFGTKRNE